MFDKTRQDLLKQAIREHLERDKYSSSKNTKRFMLSDLFILSQQCETYADLYAYWPPPDTFLALPDGEWQDNPARLEWSVSSTNNWKETMKSLNWLTCIQDGIEEFTHDSMWQYNE